MSEQQSTAENESTIVEDRDWFIQNLIFLANHGVEMGVTLTLGGSVITGNLISGKRYFEILQESFEPVLAESPWKDTLNQFFDQNASRYQLDPAEVPTERTTYIHLSNAKLMDCNGNAIPSGDGLTWRGHLSKIVGISIGTISHN